MTDTLLVLGQSIPTAATLTTLYTVPAATSVTVSSVTVCNQSSTTPDAFRLSIAVAGAADATKQYIYYNLAVGPADTFIATIGITLAATDVVRCYSSLGNLSFNIFGVQVT
jgi:hypothetical protein